MDSPESIEAYKCKVFPVNRKTEKEQKQEQQQRKKTGTKMEHYFSSDLSHLLTD